MKAFGDVFIENFSEVAGPGLRRGAKILAPPQIKRGFEKLFKRLRPNESVRKLWKKGGFDGFLEELGEERLGDFLRAITGVEDFGADNPDLAFDRIVASIPSGEELLVEALVLSFPAGLRMTASQTIDILQKRRSESEEEQLELVELEDSTADQILAAEQEDQVPDTQDLLATADQALTAEAVEPIPEETLQQLRDAGLDTGPIEDALETFQAAVDEGKSPSEAIGGILSAQGIQLTPELSEAVDRLVPRPRPRPVSFEQFLESKPQEERASIEAKRQRVANGAKRVFAEVFDDSHDQVRV